MRRDSQYDILALEENPLWESIWNLFEASGTEVNRLTTCERELQNAVSGFLSASLGEHCKTTTTTGLNNFLNVHNILHWAFCNKFSVKELLHCVHSLCHGVVGPVSHICCSQKWGSWFFWTCPPPPQENIPLFLPPTCWERQYADGRVNLRRCHWNACTYKVTRTM